MKLTNLEFSKYTQMNDKQRDDYSQAWMFIHKNKG